MFVFKIRLVGKRNRVKTVHHNPPTKHEMSLVIALCVFRPVEGVAGFKIHNGIYNHRFLLKKGKENNIK